MLCISGSPFKLDLRVEEADSKALVPYKTKYLVVEELQWCFIQSLGYLLPLDQLVMYITGSVTQIDININDDDESMMAFVWMFDICMMLINTELVLADIYTRYNTRQLLEIKLKTDIYFHDHMLTCVTVELYSVALLSEHFGSA